MQLFSSLQSAPPEPIFTVAEAAKRAGKDAINASIGIILDEEGNPLVLDCVRKALKDLEGTVDTTYPPLLGIPEFRSVVSRLAFGSDASAASIATVGGTGALTVNLKLLRKLCINRVLLPAPSWPNHRRILDALGMETVEVPYLQDGMPVVDSVIAAVQSAKEPMALLLHASCHNPTGKSFSLQQWKEIANALSGRDYPVLLDCAYQGLGKGIAEDVAAIQMLTEANVPLLLAWSASKNHTVYGLRTGLACTWTSSQEEQRKIEGHYMILTREIYSAAPTSGQRIVATVQTQYGEAWKAEIDALRILLHKKRHMLMDAFPDWKTAITGEGLFTILPLRPEQVDQLAAKHLFLTRDGRINIAGIPMGKMERVVGLIKDVRS